MSLPCPHIEIRVPISSSGPTPTLPEKVSATIIGCMLAPFVLVALFIGSATGKFK